MVALDYLITIVHSGIIVFVLIGWIWPKSRKAHGIIILLVLVAWLGLGAYFGAIGYCPLTDWQWDIKRSLGETELPNSFTKYLIDKILGIDSNKTFVDVITALGLVLGVVMASWYKIQSLKKTF